MRTLAFAEWDGELYWEVLSRRWVTTVLRMEFMEANTNLQMMEMGHQLQPLQICTFGADCRGLVAKKKLGLDRRTWHCWHFCVWASSNTSACGRSLSNYTVGAKQPVFWQVLQVTVMHLLKHRMLVPPHPQSFWFRRMRWGPRICILYTSLFLSDASAASSRTTLWDPLL